MSRTPNHLGFGRRLTRYGLAAALAASFVAVTWGATPASAAMVACPNTTHWKFLPLRPAGAWLGYGYTVYSATPTFNVSDARAVINNLSTPVSATFTSQQSRTYTLQVTAGASASLFGFLTANVSTTIVESRTTSIGVSATATVPPFGRVDGQYGVEAYNISYEAREYRHAGSRPPAPGALSCTLVATRTGQTNAPTYVEGWRLTAG